MHPRGRVPPPRHQAQQPAHQAAQGPAGPASGHWTKHFRPGRGTRQRLPQHPPPVHSPPQDHRLRPRPDVRNSGVGDLQRRLALVPGPRALPPEARLRPRGRHVGRRLRPVQAPHRAQPLRGRQLGRAVRRLRASPGRISCRRLAARLRVPALQGLWRARAPPPVRVAPEGVQRRETRDRPALRAAVPGPPKAPHGQPGPGLDLVRQIRMTCFVHLPIPHSNVESTALGHESALQLSQCADAGNRRRGEAQARRAGVDKEQAGVRADPAPVPHAVERQVRRVLQSMRRVPAGENDRDVLRRFPRRARRVLKARGNSALGRHVAAQLHAERSAPAKERGRAQPQKYVCRCTRVRCEEKSCKTLQGRRESSNFSQPHRSKRKNSRIRKA